MTRVQTILIAGLALILAACASNGQAPIAVQRLSPGELARLQPQPAPKVSLEEIVAQSKAGTPAHAIVKILAETGTVHLLTPARIVDLSHQGVDQSVIDYLAETQEKARQANLIAKLAERDAQDAAQLEREREYWRALLSRWQSNRCWGIGYGIGWGRGYYYDPLFRPWGPWGPSYW